MIALARVAGALLALLWLAGCGIDRGEAYMRAFTAAQRAHNAGRYEEAARHYAQAARDAIRLKDRDEAYYLEARMYQRLERWEDARASYENLARVSPQGPRTGRAAFDRAMLAIAHGREAEGHQELEQALLKHPNHGAARRGLRVWVAHQRELGGEARLQRELGRLTLLLGRTSLGQQLAYELGLSYQRAGELERAHAQLLKAARDHPIPKGTLTDDAYWHAAEVAAALGNTELALADLRELLSTREVATGGSYERPRYPAAQMRIAELYQSRGDHQSARRAYRQVYQNHTTSILADDAMWREALLAKRHGDDDDACDIAEDLPDRFADSRYVRCVRSLCPRLGPDEVPPSGRPCPPYILREINGAPDPE